MQKQFKYSDEAGDQIGMVWKDLGEDQKRILIQGPLKDSRENGLKLEEHESEEILKLF